MAYARNRLSQFIGGFSTVCNLLIILIANLRTAAAADIYRACMANRESQNFFRGVNYLTLPGSIPSYTPHFANLL
jgi:hypothetical protein